MSASASPSPPSRSRRSSSSCAAASASIAAISASASRTSTRVSPRRSASTESRRADPLGDPRRPGGARRHPAGRRRRHRHRPAGHAGLDARLSGLAAGDRLARADRADPPGPAPHASPSRSPSGRPKRSWRGSTASTTTMRRRRRRRRRQAGEPTQSAGQRAAQASLGLSLEALTPAMAQRLNIRDANIRGLVVGAVDPNSDAGQKGVQAGDVILSINQLPTPTPEAAAAIVDAARRAGRNTVLLQVKRGNRGMRHPRPLPRGPFLTDYGHDLRLRDLHHARRAEPDASSRSPSSPSRPGSTSRPSRTTPTRPRSSTPGPCCPSSPPAPSGPRRRQRAQPAAAPARRAGPQRRQPRPAQRRPGRARAGRRRLLGRDRGHGRPRGSRPARPSRRSTRRSRSSAGSGTPTSARAVRVDGEHYRVAGAHAGPAPAHDIAIWLGAYKPRMLRLVGRARRRLAAQRAVRSSPDARPMATRSSTRRPPRPAATRARSGACSTSTACSPAGTGLPRTGRRTMGRAARRAHPRPKGISTFILAATTRSDPAVRRRGRPRGPGTRRRRTPRPRRADPGCRPRHEPSAGRTGFQPRPAAAGRPIRTPRRAPTPDDGTRLTAQPGLDEVDPARPARPVPTSPTRRLAVPSASTSSTCTTTCARNSAATGTHRPGPRGDADAGEARSAINEMTMRQHNWTSAPTARPTAGSSPSTTPSRTTPSSRTCARRERPGSRSSTGSARSTRSSTGPRARGPGARRVRLPPGRLRSAAGSRGRPHRRAAVPPLL